MPRHRLQPARPVAPCQVQAPAAVAAAPVEPAAAPTQPAAILHLREQTAGSMPSPAELALRALTRIADESRRDPSTFYEFVMRHETTKLPLKAAPHQRVMFRFVIDFPFCVVRLPVGTGKTFGMGALGLWFLGNDVTQRGAVVSKTQGQAAKVLRMISDYVTDPELSAPLTMVFPWLERSTRLNDVWQQTQITVKRPAGIRDASVVSVGIDSSNLGSRWSWLLGDDILDADNTMTEAMREQTHSRFDARIMSRLDPHSARAAITNTPWHLDDLTFKLEHSGWPTIGMDVLGNVWFANVPEEWIRSTGMLRPSERRANVWRLSAHDPDPTETTPLWPERYSLQTINDIRARMLPHEFARLYLCQPFNESAARCQRDWIDACKRQGMGLKLEPAYAGTNPTYVAVDIGIGSRNVNDPSVIFAFEVQPDRKRRLLHITSGRWTGPDLLDKVIQAHDAYGAVVVVESNTAQDFIRQFGSDRRKDLRIRAHNTHKANKHDVDFGVESVFTEFRNCQWIIPCDENMVCDKEVEEWLMECLYYQPPPAHTGDRLMASWIGREATRRGGGGYDPKPRSGLSLEMARGGSF